MPTLVAASIFSMLPIIEAPTATAATVGSGNCVQTVGSATGVTVTTYSNRCVVKFTSTVATTWTVPRGVTKVWVLIVGGGGGGGSDEGGGGGGGGYIENQNFSVTSQSSIPLAVGAGGAGATDTNQQTGGDGDDSVFSSLTAIGGGGGGSAINSSSVTKDGRLGGSGGGGAGEGGTYRLGVAGSGTSPQGFAGGAGYTGRGGGGGGANEAGNTNGASRGGDGKATTILDGSTSSYFAGGGGGGGGNYGTNTTVAGGLGGGGTGGAGTACRTNGETNTGGGGGGAGTCLDFSGGDGGTGIIIVNYQFDNSAPTVTSSTSQSVAENTATSATILTVKTNESSTVTIASGTDGGNFVIVYNDSITSLLRFAIVPDFENPADTGANNVYNLTLNLEDYSGNTSSQAITITVTDAIESSAISSPSTVGTSYKGVNVAINVIVNAPGKVLFMVNGKRIPNCLAVATTGNYPSFVATCQWKPSVSGANVLKARLTPTSNTYDTKTSENTTIWVIKRTTTR